MVTSVKDRNLQSEEENGRVVDINWRRSSTLHFAHPLLPQTDDNHTLLDPHRLAEAYLH